MMVLTAVAYFNEEMRRVMSFCFSLHMFLYVHDFGGKEATMRWLMWT